MRLILLVLFFFICLIILFYLLKNNKSELNATQAKKAIDNNEFDYIVDVRTKPEWDQGYHPLAIHIPIGDLVTLLPQMIPNKNDRILFYCKKGIRASGTMEIAKRLGYKNIKYLDARFTDLQKL